MTLLLNFAKQHNFKVTRNSHDRPRTIMTLYNEVSHDTISVVFYDTRMTTYITTHHNDVLTGDVIKHGKRDTVRYLKEKYRHLYQNRPSYTENKGE